MSSFSFFLSLRCRWRYKLGRYADFSVYRRFRDRLYVRRSLALAVRRFVIYFL